jgi:cytochrome c oxidase subunit 2
MAKALLFALWLITLLCLCLFWFHPWWLPPLASVQGAAIDRQFKLTFTLVGIAFLLAQTALGSLVWKYSARRSQPERRLFRENTIAEVAWTLLTSLLFFTFAWTGARSWSQSNVTHAAADAKLPVEVEVTGMQFAWYFRYPGPDRVFGRTRPELQDASSGSAAAVGLDMSDAASQDDFVSTTLVVPVNRNARLTLRAQDVIHSFFVPELRFKQDAVPGMAIPVVFTPNRQGNFEIACASLCGLGHYRMRAAMKVVSETEFDEWLAKHAPQGARRPQP